MAEEFEFVKEKEVRDKKKRKGLLVTYQYTFTAAKPSSKARIVFTSESKCSFDEDGIYEFPPKNKQTKMK